MRLRFLGSLLGLLGATLALAPAPARALAPGDPAPDFLVTDVQGGPAIRMADYQGQVVLLAFFWVY